MLSNEILDETLALSAQQDYDRHYSQIPQDVFEKICKMDPKTQIVGDEIRNIGFGAKQLLITNYLKGDTGFVDNNLDDDIKEALTRYYPHIKEYPKFNQFENIDDFLAFIADPEGSDIEIKEPERPQRENNIDKIYHKYYASIDREVFDKIIALDPQTSANSIGEVAKNLLLPRYMAGETDFVEDDRIKPAIERFYADRETYSAEAANISSYNTVKAFIEYEPESPTIAATRGITEGVDYKRVASSRDYDVFKILTYKGSTKIAHARGANNVWCTAGGSDGNQYGGSDDGEVPSRYWVRYTVDDSCTIYEFISKENPTDRTKNFNASFNMGNQCNEFRDGNNDGNSGSPNKTFKKFLLSNPETAKAISTCSDPVLKNSEEVKSVIQLINLGSSDYLIDSLDKFTLIIKERETIMYTLTSVTVKNVSKVPAGIFEGMFRLETVTIGEGVKEIGTEAFKNSSVTKLTLGPDLEIIGGEAFANCKLKGSIRLPDSLKEIKEKAFYGNRGYKLKINKNRPNKLKINANDRQWAINYIEPIDVQD